MTEHAAPTVAIFEADLPPALAFIRSLGRRSVPLRVYGPSKWAAGRFSRYTDRFDISPDAVDVDVFHEWLEIAVERDGIDLVAPTSDYIAFAVAEFDDRHGTRLSGGIGGHLGAEAVRDCLFKDRFARRMSDIGFSVPAWSAPTSTDEALADAERLGYPVVAKPKSHIGVGPARGFIARNADELRERFAPFQVSATQESALRHDPDLAYPLLQKLIDGRDVRVDSVSGHVDRHGEVRGLEFSTKLDQWGRGLAIGTLFETIPEPVYLEPALDAVRQLLPRGIFELEVLVDLENGSYTAIELNPRGYGQMSLSIARGSDLPALWLEDAADWELPSIPTPSRPPTQWRLTTPYLAGRAVRIVAGPDRAATTRDLMNGLRRPTAGAMHAWHDPVPGPAFVARILRNPGGLVRPYLRER